MKNCIKISLIIAFVFVNTNAFAQSIISLNVESEYSHEDIGISKKENFIVRNISNVNLLSELETYCNGLQATIVDKYLDHTYVFFPYESGVLDENINLSLENLYNLRTKAIAVLRYHKKRNGDIEKRFMLLSNGSPLKYYIDGVEKPKVN
jgi:hypothetical protein